MAACSLPSINGFFAPLQKASTQRTLLRSFNPWILRGIGIEAGGIITYLIIVLAVTLTVLRAAFGRIFREPLILTSTTQSRQHIP